MAKSLIAKPLTPEVEARVAAYHARRAATERERLQHQDAALLKICVDGADDLDWALIFASIDPDQA